MDKKIMKEIDKILEENGKPTIMGKPLPHYDREDSMIPERIRVSFSNGKTAVYDLHVEQPAPVIMENIQIIRRMQGYVNQPITRRRGRK